MGKNPCTQVINIFFAYKPHWNGNCLLGAPKYCRQPPQAKVSNCRLELKPTLIEGEVWILLTLRLHISYKKSIEARDCASQSELLMDYIPESDIARSIISQKSYVISFPSSIM